MTRKQPVFLRFGRQTIRLRNFIPSTAGPKLIRRFARKSAYYEGMIRIDLSQINPLIALPIPSVQCLFYRELLEKSEVSCDPSSGIRQNIGRKLQLNLLNKIHQSYSGGSGYYFAGCAGGMFDNISAAADILDQGSIGNDYFSLSVLSFQHAGQCSVNRKWRNAETAESRCTTENGLLLHVSVPEMFRKQWPEYPSYNQKLSES